MTGSNSENPIRHNVQGHAPAGNETPKPETHQSDPTAPETTAQSGLCAPPCSRPVESDATGYDRRLNRVESAYIFRAINKKIEVTECKTYNGNIESVSIYDLPYAAIKKLIDENKPTLFQNEIATNPPAQKLQELFGKWVRGEK